MSRQITNSYLTVNQTTLLWPLETDLFLSLSLYACSAVPGCISLQLRAETTFFSSHRARQQLATKTPPNSMTCPMWHLYSYSTSQIQQLSSSLNVTFSLMGWFKQIVHLDSFSFMFVLVINQKNHHKSRLVLLRHTCFCVINRPKFKSYFTRNLSVFCLFCSLEFGMTWGWVMTEILFLNKQKWM